MFKIIHEHEDEHKQALQCFGIPQSWPESDLYTALHYNGTLAFPPSLLKKP